MKMEIFQQHFMIVQFMKAQMYPKIESHLRKLF